MSDTEDKDIEQPPTGNAGIIPGKKFMAGSVRSQERLAELGFDPIERLVMQYKDLEAEDKWFENLRSATVNMELDADGKVKKMHKYSAHAHAKIKELLNKTANDLLRYNYGRVPESINLNLDRNPGLVVNMPDGPKVINGESVDILDSTMPETKHKTPIPKLISPSKG